jgi:hypothetical protein
MLGVKCGVNEAFVVEEVGGDEQRALVRSGAREGLLERELLRPLLRGESVNRGSALRERIIWTHDARGGPLEQLPPHAAQWLAPFRARLLARTDLRGRSRWWQLFRIEGATPRSARVVWPDVASETRVAVLEPDNPTVPLNSCYVVRCRDVSDARTLAAILGSPLAWAWLSLLGEPARGAYRRLLGWTMALFPVPQDWACARVLLSPHQNPASSSESTPELMDRVLRAYRLSRHEVSALLEWNSS